MVVGLWKTRQNKHKPLTISILRCGKLVDKYVEKWWIGVDSFHLSDKFSTKDSGFSSCFAQVFHRFFHVYLLYPVVWVGVATQYGGHDAPEEGHGIINHDSPVSADENI